MARKPLALERRGRTILLTTLGLFFVGQILGGLLLDYRWPELRYPAAWDRFAAAERGIDRTGRTPTVLYLGSSRIQSDINASVLTKHMQRLTGRDDFWVFDGSIKAADPVVMEFAFNELVQRGVKPECVIVEVTPEGLNRRTEYIGEHVVRMLRWEDTLHYLRELAQTSNLGRLALARVLPLYVHRFELLRIVQDHVEEFNPRSRLPGDARPGAGKPVVARAVSLKLPGAAAETDATEPIPLTAYQVEATGGGMGMIHRCLRNYQVGGRPCEALERLLAECNKHGAQVLLLGVPVSSAQRKLYTSAIDVPYRAYLAQLEKTYGCRFVDCHNRIPDHLFADNHHALHAGGLHFTRLLAQEVLQSLWSNRIASSR